MNFDLSNYSRICFIPVEEPNDHLNAHDKPVIGTNVDYRIIGTMLAKCLVWITDFDIILVIEGLGNNSTKVGLAEELVSLCAIGLARPACSQHLESPQFLLASADENWKIEFSMLFLH